MKTVEGVDVGEFRADGNQSIIWGIHPGTKMPYTRPLNVPAARIAFDEISWPAGVVSPLLHSSGDVESRRRRVEDVVSGVSPVPVQVNLVQCAHGGNSLPEVLRAKVESCLPSGPHQNNRLLFHLARRLKWVEGITPVLLSEAFNMWHARTAALGFLRAGQSKDDYAGEFDAAVARAKTPPQIFESALNLARSNPLPPEANIFESDPAKLVCAICFQLHLQTPDGETWYLPSRKCNEHLGIHWTSVARYLARLTGAGVIVQVEPARMSNILSERRSPRYIWKGFQAG
ncbi:MAG: hypothetical protein QM813_10875 [Verrucomicrobiota bacterium]